MDQELDRFADLLIRHVRDRAIEVCDRHAAGIMRGPSGRRWRAVLQQPAPDAIVELIPDIVDEVLFELLNAIDNELVPLAWLCSDGNVVTLEELGLGEMAGRHAGGDWPKRFSSKRWTDQVPDLGLEDPG
jgi:hypothetical protein